jgi:hypothetical protein
LTPIKFWKSYPVPTNPDTLQKYNSDPNNWIVSIDSNEIYVINKSRNTPSDTLPFAIKPTKEEQRMFVGKRSILKVVDGYLVGFNRGEWGGSLYWFSDDGAKRYKISNDQIVQFKKRDNKIYAIEGLAHMSLSEGSIIEIKKENEKWTSFVYQKLPTAPDAIELDSKNNFIIVTSSSLLSVDINKNTDILIATGMWDYLSPGSLVIKNDIVFIGMRKGVFKYNLVTKKEEWLLPN